MDLPFAQPDRGVQRSEPPEAQMNRRHRRAWAHHPVLFLKDWDKFRGHQDGG